MGRRPTVRLPAGRARARPPGAPPRARAPPARPPPASRWARRALDSRASSLGPCLNGTDLGAGQ